MLRCLCRVRVKGHVNDRGEGQFSPALPPPLPSPLSLSLFLAVSFLLSVSVIIFYGVVECTYRDRVFRMR